MNSNGLNLQKFRKSNNKYRIILVTSTLFEKKLIVLCTTIYKNSTHSLIREEFTLKNLTKRDLFIIKTLLERRFDFI